MAKKYYAVKAGLVPGIYTDWETCKAQVTSFPGAQYKGFATLAEAEEYLGISGSGPAGSSFDSPVLSDVPAVSVPEGCAVAYVDGSFRESAGKFSYGVVFFSNDGTGEVQEQHFSKAFSEPELLEMRNVSGEIMGAAQAMKVAARLGLKGLTIYHDYEGIAKWCLGLWKTNKPWVRKYKAFYDEISKDLNITFIKVKGHSGDHWNDIADELAKKALDE